jgi:hypothetical protein
MNLCISKIIFSFYGLDLILVGFPVFDRESKATEDIMGCITGYFRCARFINIEEIHEGPIKKATGCEALKPLWETLGDSFQTLI